MCKVPRRINPSQALTKSLATVVCLALFLSTTTLVAARHDQAGTWNWLGLFSQDHRNGPRQGALQGVFPNLD